MVQVGTIEYHAVVTGASEARGDAEDVGDSFTQMGEQAEVAAGATGFLGGILGSTSDDLEQTNEEAEDTDTSFTLLTGTTWLLSRALGSIGGAGIFAGLVGGAKSLIGWLSGLTLSGVLGSVTGALSSFVGWLAAGSAGALAVAGAIGAVIGLFGVWILEITGVLDWIGKLGQQLANALPNWARDGIQAIIGLFAGPLAVIGGFIVGFIEGGFDRAFERAGQVIDIFFGAFKRTFNRIAGFFKGLWDGLARFLAGVWDGIKQTARNVWNGIQATVDGVVNGVEQAWQGAKNFVAGLWRGLKQTANRIFGVIEGTVDSAAQTFENVWRGAKNTVVGFFETIEEWVDRIMGWLDGIVERAGEAADAVREASPVGGPGGSASDEGAIAWTGFPVDVPFAQEGGTVEETGAAVIHQGETVLPPDVTAALSRSGGGGGGANVTQVESVTVELSGEFDPSTLNRRQLDSLADDLVDLIGEKANRKSGIR